MPKLINTIIFGPVKSRRLGISLGVNLLPSDGKMCNYNCIYCECGWNEETHSKSKIPPMNIVIEQLEAVLKNRNINEAPLDSITFAGNGEPTLHHQFSEIINQSINLRNQYFPNAKLSVLTNASNLRNKLVTQSLMKTDYSMLKLDSVVDETYNLINQPINRTHINEIIESIKEYKGEKYIQSMFIKGEFNGKKFDNTTDKEIESWLKVLNDIKPYKVFVYSLDRDTPLKSIVKIDKYKLNEIAEKVKGLGLIAEVY